MQMKLKSKLESNSYMQPHAKVVGTAPFAQGDISPCDADNDKELRHPCPANVLGRFAAPVAHPRAHEPGVTQSAISHRLSGLTDQIAEAFITTLPEEAGFSRLR